MTLIVAIKCSDGIVLGADGAASLGTMGSLTVKQVTKKLEIIDQKIVVGVSGPVGLGQRIRGVVAGLWADKKFAGKSGPLKSHEAMTLMRRSFWPDIETEVEAAKAFAPLIGQPAASSCLSATIVALPIGQQMCLFQFDQQGAPEEATNHLPFISIGSAQKTADPFLGFLRRNFWPQGLPNLADATFATYWTLDYAIRGEPAYVGEPKQIVTVTRDGQTWRATELTEQELGEHEQSVVAAETALRRYREPFESGSTTMTTPPPSPPSL